MRKITKNYRFIQIFPPIFNKKLKNDTFFFKKYTKKERLPKLGNLSLL